MMIEQHEIHSNSKNRPLYVFFTASPFAAIVVAPPVLGVIFYEAETPEDFVGGRAKNLGQASMAQINDAWGTSSLTSLLIGF